MRAVSYDEHVVQFFGACTTTEPAMLVMEYMRVSRGRHPSQRTEFGMHTKARAGAANRASNGLEVLHTAEVPMPTIGIMLRLSTLSCALRSHHAVASQATAVCNDCRWSQNSRARAGR